jgi:ubiquitin-protein ligase
MIQKAAFRREPMASPRIRRLKLDHETLTRRFAGSPVIAITGAAGLPPEMYRFQYKLKGIYVTPAGEILERDTHVLEVHLSLEYPRRAPQCRMLTPVFHPNFDDASVCIGDFWAASEGLDDLVIRIGRMIAYQEYNTRSPLNGLAAKWAAEHLNLLPIDSRIVAPPLDAPSPGTPPPPRPAEDPWSGTVRVAETVPADPESSER